MQLQLKVIRSRKILVPFGRRAFTTALLSVGMALVQAKEPALDTTFWNERYEAAKKFMVSMPRPEYPMAARSLRQTGSGLYWLHFTKSGRVDAVKIAESAGHAVLDQAAVNAFYQWNCQPGKVDQLIVPVTFTMDDRRLIGGHPF